MQHKQSLLLLFLLSLFLSCEKNQVTPREETIFGLWRYQSGVDLQVFDNASDLFPLAYLRLREDGTMSGHTSRNIFDGTYTYDPEGNIELTIIGMTRAADTPWSAEYTRMLRSVNQYRLEGEQLILSDTDSGEEYTFLSMSGEACRPVINDRTTFDALQSDDFDLLEVNALDQCLELLIGYGGGCKGIGVALIGSGDYAESEPPQLAVKIIVEDNDNCEAYIQEYFYFDVTDLQYEGSDALILNIAGWNEQVSVSY
jgi:heat shock protein HslJ